MAQRELDILAKARTILNDRKITNYRWTQERLMELLEEGQEDMCRNIPMVARKATINTASGQEEYNLPLDSVKLLVASSEGRPLDITAYDEIERDNPGWEEDSGATFTCIVVNALSQNVIRPYPLSTKSIPIKVRYHALPVRLGWDSTTLDSVEELSISSMWDVALKQYIVGQAFLDYGDESSISRSQVALGLYSKDFTRAEGLARKSFSKRSPTTGYQAKVANTRYRGGRYGSGSSRFSY